MAKHRSTPAGAPLDRSVVGEDAHHTVAAFNFLIDALEQVGALEDPILEDYVSILSPDGKEKQRISLLECFENSDEKHSWKKASDIFWEKNFLRRLAYERGDIFHTNSLAVDWIFQTSIPTFHMAHGRLTVKVN